MDYVCNNEKDCHDSSDELGCEICKKSEFQCKNKDCIFIQYKCNCIPDCKDGSDEENCEMYHCS